MYRRTNSGGCCCSSGTGTGTGASTGASTGTGTSASKWVAAHLAQKACLVWAARWGTLKVPSRLQCFLHVDFEPIVGQCLLSCHAVRRRTN